MIKIEERAEENDVLREFDKAKTAGRQPTCPYCNKPLEISQVQYESIDWKWNNKKKIYEKEVTGVDPDKPFCSSCETKDWDFLNSGLIDF
ncbi:MAG: hypothetical protein ABSB22_23525 [Thermodesulfobacteriota bacterium]